MMDYEEVENVTLSALNAYQKAINTVAIVSITDTGGKIVYVNDFFCRISQYTREELIGRTHRIINSSSHSSEFFSDLWRTIQAGEIWHGEIKNNAKDGSCYWVDTTIAPVLNNEGQIIQYLSIRTLITERKELEQEKQNLMTQLTQKYNELMQFNYIVSHNLRTPVGNIISLLQLLLEDCEKCGANAKDLIRYISQSALSIDDVIKDLTQILQASNSSHQQIEEINLLDVISSIENNLKKQIAETNTQLQVHIQDDAVLYKSFKSYLQSIFYNLISNAIKYRKENVLPVIVIKAEKTIVTS
jgi:PAS domain S-box-containing protein